MGSACPESPLQGHVRNAGSSVEAGKNLRAVIRPLEDYEFPMVTLHEDTTGSAVCTIFETLNRTGVKLGVFDLLTARFWAQDLNLRQLWDEARSEYPIIDEFEVDPYYILQIIGLIEPGFDKEGQPKAPSIKRSAILEMKVEQARKGWPDAVEGLAGALEILREDCGVLTAGLIPYNTIVIPMAATWAAQKAAKGASAGANRLKILRWFWCAVFGQQYENAPNSQAEKDFGQLGEWMNGGPQPESVSAFVLNTLSLRNTRPKQRAVYRGIMAIILQNGALDFHKRGKITSQLLADRKNPVDDHHIFPRAFLNERQAAPALRDCILNRTYIDRVTNRRLSKRAPSDYFAEIEQKQGRDSTDELLKSHLLPVGPDSSLARDDFEAFLADREERVLGLISRKTGAADLAGSQQQMVPVSAAKLPHGIYKITPAGHEELDNPHEWARTNLPVLIVEALGESGCSLAEIVNRAGDEDAVHEKLRKWMRQGWVVLQRD